MKHLTIKVHHMSFFSNPKKIHYNGKIKNSKVQNTSLSFNYDSSENYDSSKKRKTFQE